MCGATLQALTWKTGDTGICRAVLPGMACHLLSSQQPAVSSSLAEFSGSKASQPAQRMQLTAAFSA